MLPLLSTLRSTLPPFSITPLWSAPSPLPLSSELLPPPPLSLLWPSTLTTVSPPEAALSSPLSSPGHPPVILAMWPPPWSRERLRPSPRLMLRLTLMLTTMDIMVTTPTLPAPMLTTPSITTSVPTLATTTPTTTMPTLPTPTLPPLLPQPLSLLLPQLPLWPPPLPPWSLLPLQLSRGPRL